MKSRMSKSIDRLGKRTKGLRAFFQNPRATAGFLIFVLFAAIAILAPVIAPYSPNATTFAPLQPPDLRHPFGTTGTGQDVFSQFVWGTRTSLIIGVGSGLLTTALALLIGMYPGYRGGWLDRIFDTFINVFLVIPGLPLMIVIASYVHNTGPYVIIFVISFTGWAAGARIFRAQTMTVARRDFIVAAKLAGASDLRIIFSEILPNMLSLVISSLMYATLGGIMAEAGLEFLGLGNVSTVSWGTMLYWSDAGGAMFLGAWWWLIPGGLAIALFGMSLALMNYGVDQVTNPRLRPPRKTRSDRFARGGDAKPSAASPDAL